MLLLPRLRRWALAWDTKWTVVRMLGRVSRQSQFIPADVGADCSESQGAGLCAAAAAACKEHLRDRCTRAMRRPLQQRCTGCNHSLVDPVVVARL